MQKEVGIFNGGTLITEKIVKVNYIHLSDNQIDTLNKMISVLQNTKINNRIIKDFNYEEHLFNVAKTIGILKYIVSNTYIDELVEVTDILKYSCSHIDINDTLGLTDNNDGIVMCRICKEKFEEIIDMTSINTIIDETLDILHLFSNSVVGGCIVAINDIYK